MTRWLAVPTVLALAQAAAAQTRAPCHRPPECPAGFGSFRQSAAFAGPWHAPGTYGVNPNPAFTRPASGFGVGFRPLGFGLSGVVVPGAEFESDYAPPLPVNSGAWFGRPLRRAVAADPEPPADPVPARPAEPFDPTYLSSALGARRAAQTAAATTITTKVTLTLPADAEVWLNGVKQTGTGRAFDLAVTTAKPGESVTFDLVARWPSGGRAVEYTRTLTLDAGEKQSLAVARGTPVK